MRLKPLRHRTSFLAIIILALSSLPALAHASTYVGYGSSNVGSSTCGTNCEATGATTNGIGEIVVAPFTGSLVAAGFYTGSTLPNQIVILTGSTTSTSYSCGSAGTCARANSGGSFTVQDVEALSGLVGSTFFTVNLANPVSVTNGQQVAIVFMATTGSTTNGEIMFAGTGGSSAFLDTGIQFATTNPIVGNAYACCAVGLENGPHIVGGSFTPQGTTGTTVTVTQCYGNCGSPAITLANTNSSHTINFNRSITIFYEFQSNINGFLLNVTTNLAKTYFTPQVPYLAIYNIPQPCPAGQLPFTAQCPANDALGFSPGQGLSKGKISIVASSGQIPVFNGEWLAVALSSTLSGLDVNDTNTNVPLFQVSGLLPAYITQASTATNLCAGCKIGLWAWIVGNVVSGNGPSQPGQALCPGLDCILSNVVNNSCSVITVACQTASSMFWIIILTIISIFVMVFMFNEIVPTVNLGRVGLGEMSVLIFIMWIAIFTSFNLMSLYPLVLIFAITAIIFGRKVNAYI